MIWPSSGWRDIFETFRYQYAHKMFCMHFIISATTTLYGLVWGDCTSHHYDANYNPLPQDGDIQYFMVHELYYTGGRDDVHVRKKVILTVEGIAEVLKHYHSNPMGGHSGVNATLGKVSALHHWNGMKEDIQEYVSYSLKSNFDEDIGV